MSALTLDELNLIHDMLNDYRNSESCADLMDTASTDEALRIVQREIKLKELNPVTGTKEGKITNAAHPKETDLS